MARGPYVKTCMSGRVQKLVSRQNLALCIDKNKGQEISEGNCGSNKRNEGMFTT